MRVPASDSGAELGKLRWRCRRGMKELDELLGRYLAEQWSAAPEAHRQAFRELLDVPDPQIYAWVMGQETPATQTLRSLIEHITRSFPPAAPAIGLEARC